MNKLGILISGILCLFKYNHNAQNISGVVNNYAIVTNISGTGISIPSATAFHPGDRVLLVQMKGAVIDISNSASFGDITSMGGAGTFEFLNIASVSGHTVTSASALTHTYNFSSGLVQLVRVPRFCTPTATSALTCASWNISTGGGIIALEAGTLTLNADIDASGKGFNGGDFAVSSFNCDNGNYSGIAGVNGGQKGESISAYLTGLDGLKGKQANGGGAGNSGNSGGGGGANAGAGGYGGNQYSGCTGIYDERGVGGASLTSSSTLLFMGGGGGGGFKDNGLVATNGGNGGGIIYIRANVIIANSHTINASGENVTILSDAEGAGGGGAGGTIFIECNTINGNLAVKTDGGFGGSNNNSAFFTECHGTGGGGGGGVFAFSQATLPSGIIYSCAGGAAGTVNNAASSCFGTTNGATAGTNGVSLPGLPTSSQVLSATSLSVTQSSTICSGESASITASGAAFYNWSNGSTNTTIVVSPTVTSSYTVTGAGSGTSACQSSTVATVPVSGCVSISDLSADQNEVNIYPNPTRGKLSVSIATAFKIIICDETGRKILEQNCQSGEHSLDIGNYAPGVYFIKAIGNTGTRVTKLIKTE